MWHDSELMRTITSGVAHGMQRLHGTALDLATDQTSIIQTIIAAPCMHAVCNMCRHLATSDYTLQYDQGM